MTPYFHIGPKQTSTTLFCCDNLELLRKMPSNCVTLIYCDVLYNSGKSFKDYKDNLGSPQEAIEWYRPRIEEMRRILKDNGSIYIHCNWRLDAYLRILMDEIFGMDCFKNQIHRQHSDKRGFYDNYDSQMDTILYYVKNPNDYIFNMVHGDRENIVPLFEVGRLDGRDDVRWLGDQIIDLASMDRHWMVSPTQFEKMVANNEVRLIDGLPFRYTTIVSIGNLWNEPDMLDPYSRTQDSKAFSTPKPKAVLERIINISSNPGDLVVDFFLGGGTTAVVAHMLGRRFIGCDINEDACRITADKIRELNRTNY